MEFSRGNKTYFGSKKELKHEKVSYEEIRREFYSIPMTMYAIPPLGKLDLVEAEHLVEERIKLLRVFDIKPILTGTDWNMDCPGSLKSLLHAVRSWDGGDNFYVVANNKAPSVHRAARVRNHVSHFLLRLYCCRSQELKKWFIWHEMKFLQFQLLDNDNKLVLGEFLRINNFPFQPVGITEREELDERQYYFKNMPNIDHIHIYKMELKQAFDVVRQRKCVLEGGVAYVMQDDMVGIICSRFKMELSHMMARMAQRLPRLEEDDRLIPIIGAVHNELVIAADKRSENDARLKSRKRITPQMVNTLCLESFPPCMRFIHENLRKDHHLKHYGRLYYNLFLKSIGMSVEDAIEFFRQEFVQKITPEKFAKEYTYGIRYNYGQEGKKVELSAYGCQKILNSNPPGTGDAHGCPFRHQDSKNLEVMLRRHGIDDDNIRSIMSEVEAKKYTAGCTKYFQCKHPNATIRAEGGEIYHPNQFFAESRRALSGYVNPVKAEEGEEGDGNVEQQAEERDPEQFYDDEGEMEAIDAAIAASEQKAADKATETAVSVAEPASQTGVAQVEDAVAMDVDPASSGILPPDKEV